MEEVKSHPAIMRAFIEECVDALVFKRVQEANVERTSLLNDFNALSSIAFMGSLQESVEEAIHWWTFLLTRSFTLGLHEECH